MRECGFCNLEALNNACFQFGYGLRVQMYFFGEGFGWVAAWCDKIPDLMTRPEVQVRV